jgi:hypothetical protein
VSTGGAALASRSDSFERIASHSPDDLIVSTPPAHANTISFERIKQRTEKKKEKENKKEKKEKKEREKGEKTEEEREKERMKKKEKRASRKSGNYTQLIHTGNSSGTLSAVVDTNSDAAGGSGSGGGLSSSSPRQEDKSPKKSHAKTMVQPFVPPLFAALPEPTRQAPERPAS